MAREVTSPGVAVERLGRYELLGEIASGGMATVFLGRVTGAKGFQRLVAIKRLHPHLETEEDFVSMFLDEARLAARIRHQNVVGTLDVEDQNGLYIVMEYIEGDRLLALLRHAAKTKEHIPLPVAMRVALDTLAGLHAAHELCDDDGEPLGLVHRDVSPQNILIGVDGVARLTDFGIAKASARLTVTRDGQLKGKIAYMAPEQTKRVEIDRRVDIFAMGIITWEMLTSKKLFTGDSDVEVLNQLLFEPIPRVKESVPSIPAVIDAAVMKALERDPNKRYESAAEFADALERACKAIGGPANARQVAQYLQKAAAEKLARDRSRFATGQHQAVNLEVPAALGGSGTRQRKMTGGGYEQPGDTGVSSPGSRPQITAQGARPSVTPRPAPPPPPPQARKPAVAPGAGPSLLDDVDESPTNVTGQALGAPQGENFEENMATVVQSSPFEGPGQGPAAAPPPFAPPAMPAARSPLQRQAPPAAFVSTQKVVEPSAPGAQHSNSNPLGLPRLDTPGMLAVSAPAQPLPVARPRSNVALLVGAAVVLFAGGGALVWVLTSTRAPAAPSAATQPTVIAAPLPAPPQPAPAVTPPAPAATQPTTPPAPAPSPAPQPAANGEEHGAHSGATHARPAVRTSPAPARNTAPRPARRGGRGSAGGDEENPYH